MRLHRLTITAFGPFAGTVEVDLDELSDAGLFLLSGPTGAGKTSVLDAVCFALYGDVPGDRSTARRLRCDTAPALVAPRVELEATLAGRRFRFVRQPAWERPKKRGTGTTTEQAKVVVQELDAAGAEPRTLTTRADEAGQLVTGLLGMTLTQFCQVALLPQGRFEAFLRSRPDDRQRLLQRLFRTERFADVERWLRDHRAALRTAEDDAHRRVLAAVDRIVEAAGAEPPAALGAGGDAASGRPDGEALTTWAEGLVAATGAAARESADDARRSTEAAEQARTRCTDAQRTAEAAERGRRALDALAELDAGAGSLAAARARLADAERARPVLPLARVAEQARRAADAAALRAEEEGRHCWTVVGAVQPTVEELREALAEAEARLAAVRAALPREQARRRAEVEAQQAAEQVARLRERIADLDAEVADLPARLVAARAAAAAAADEAAALAGLEAEERDLDERVREAERAASLEERLAPARAALDASRSEVLALKERWLQLREARLDGMAAELARDLAVGGCCPVCGSHSHPSKAAATVGAPGEPEERAARKAHDDAEVGLVAHEAQVRDLEVALAAARAAAGGATASALRERRSGVRSAVAAARAAEASLAALARDVHDLEAAAERARDERSGLEAEVVRLDEVRAQRLRAAEEAAADVAAALGGVPGDPAALAAELGEAVDLVGTALAAAEEAGRADDHARAAAAEADRCAGEHGFDDVPAAVAAALPEAERTALERRTAAADAARTAAEAALADPAVSAALAAPAADLDALHAAADEATARAEASSGAAHVAAQRATRTETLAAALREAVAAWTPVHASYALADHLASFCEGRSADNRLRTRLSAYVVAWRLGQVVDAANLRLDAMSDGRYALEHTSERGAGEVRGGLGLLVRDAWSGATRDPATLSGGETFVVALALALGLADVVVQEAGGADLGTLFVDEGFGSLDADTLDDVLDHLDALRDGGRVVGVVSHVAEVRDRVPVRLEVRKDRGGSTVRTVRG